MRILEISVGRPQEMRVDNKTVTTSIFKSPVTGPQRVTTLNIAGDEQADLSVHGGRDKAVYVYSRDYHDAWAAELRVQTLEASQFGENLTVSGGTDDEVVVGARYCIGDVEVVVTQPRIPCYKLGIRLGDATFPNRFWLAGRLGFYLRVEREGVIESGQSLELVEQPGHGITVHRLYDIVGNGSAAEAGAALEKLPYLDGGWQRRLRARQRPEEAGLN